MLPKAEPKLSQSNWLYPLRLFNPHDLGLPRQSFIKCCIPIKDLLSPGAFSPVPLPAPRETAMNQG